MGNVVLIKRHLTCCGERVYSVNGKFVVRPWLVVVKFGWGNATGILTVQDNCEKRNGYCNDIRGADFYMGSRRSLFQLNSERIVRFIPQHSLKFLS